MAIGLGTKLLYFPIRSAWWGALTSSTLVCKKSFNIGLQPEMRRAMQSGMLTLLENTLLLVE